MKATVKHSCCPIQAPDADTHVWGLGLVKYFPREKWPVRRDLHSHPSRAEDVGDEQAAWSVPLLQSGVQVDLGGQRHPRGRKNAL